MHLVFFLKARGSGQNMTKTKVVGKNVNRRRSDAKGLDRKRCR